MSEKHHGVTGYKPLLASLGEAGVIGAMALLIGATAAEALVLMACYTLIVWWGP